MRKLLLLPLIFITIQSIACRYTIREIGFSTLSQTLYSLYWVEENISDDKEQAIKTRTAQLEDHCNLKLQIIDPTTNNNHSIVKYIGDNRVKLPAVILGSPDGRYLTIEIKVPSPESFESIINSPIQNKLINILPESYAALLLIESNDSNKNQIAVNIAEKSCTAIKNVMPNMPKIVDGEPVIIKINKDDFKREKVLLWCLGIDKIPDTPSAFVLYGRGRIMSRRISFDMIKDGDIYKFLSIVGADCECGLDRKWMLGKQVIMKWNKQTEQFLFSLLDFDVDNPMILAEMSRIITTEKKDETTSDISFEPRTINIDKELGSISEEVIKEDGNPLNNIILIGLIFILIIIITGVIILKKKN
jgi:hypothetical protein